MSHKVSKSTSQHLKTLLVAIDAPYNKTKYIQQYFDEFIHLIKSNDVSYDHIISMKLRSIDHGHFLTQGKLEELQELCAKEKFEQIIFSEILSPLQERNLNELLDCNIYDRTQLILEIFEKSAHSAEGKLQVAMAMHNHRKARVSGHGVNMSQQAGFIGGKGSGETAKEKALRVAENEINTLKKQLKTLENARTIQRKRRLTNQIPHICLVGYTNSGKSTLLNTLTHAEVLAEDKLFATLDTTTRELFINHEKKGVISDTVGFIQNLPPQLIEAFKSTLAELNYADLLLHIVDISNINWKEHIAVVNTILNEINIEKPILYVFNKIDKIDEATILQLSLSEYQPHVLISAQSKQDITQLIDFLRLWSKK